MAKKKGQRKELENYLRSAWEAKERKGKLPGTRAATPEMSTLQEDIKGFGLERSDEVAIAVGVIVALVLYLEPRKSVPLVIGFLILLALCTAYLLFHWFSRLPWIDRVGGEKKKLRIVVSGVIAIVLIVLYGWHVWPQEDPIERKLDQLSLGQEFGTDKLTSQFPIGYVVFQLKTTDKLEFYRGLSLIENYDFDWTKVKYLKNEKDSFTVILPDVIAKRGPQPQDRFIVSGNSVTGPKRIGWSANYFRDDVAGFRAVAEVLDVADDGIVFVVGLMPLHAASQEPKHSYVEFFATPAYVKGNPLVPFYKGEHVQLNIGYGDGGNFSIPKSTMHGIVVLTDRQIEDSFQKYRNEIEAGPTTTSGTLTPRGIGTYITHDGPRLTSRDVKQLINGDEALCWLSLVYWQDESGEYETDEGHCYIAVRGHGQFSWRALQVNQRETKLGNAK